MVIYIGRATDLYKISEIDIIEWREHMTRMGSYKLIVHSRKGSMVTYDSFLVDPEGNEHPMAINMTASIASWLRGMVDAGKFKKLEAVTDTNKS